jgi:hypothetical protein
MKILAIIDVAPHANMDTIRTELAGEVRGSWKLFEQAVLRDAYATSSPTRVVFVLEADDIKSAEAHLQGLPLISAKLLHTELIELRPFINWSMLFGR